MNFKVAGSANSRDYIAAGKAGAKGVRNAFIAARKSAPDYGGLGETAMSARSAERRAATKAEADVAKTGLAAMEYTKRAEIKADTDKYLADKKAGATRMAGIVGGLGAIAGGAFMGIENKREKKAQAERDRLEQERWDQRIDAITKHNERPGYVAPEPLPLPNTVDDLEKPEFQTAPSLNDPQPSEEPQPAQVPAQNLSSSDSGVGQLSQSMNSPISDEQFKGYALKAGFTPEQIPLITAIAKGESGLKPGAHNPDASTGDNSYGLMQINMLGDMGPERRAQFGIKSNEELYDPQTNLNAAYKIYQQQGLGAWGAYTNNSYKNHL